MRKPVISKAYLQVDPKKCAGCCTCMLACSLVHEGKSNLSLARIFVFSNSFGSYPTDIAVHFCRQCAKPLCYFACPLADKALCIDEATGVRYIDANECDGCRRCVAACPYTPSRIVFRADRSVAAKCDMCRSAPYWSKPGTPACVSICPMKAIQFTAKTPKEPNGYIVNLRSAGWKKLNFPTDR